MNFKRTLGMKIYHCLFPKNLKIQYKTNNEIKKISWKLFLFSLIIGEKNMRRKEKELINHSNEKKYPKITYEDYKKLHLTLACNNKKSIRNFHEIIKLNMIMVFFNPHVATNRIRFTCRMLHAPFLLPTFAFALWSP